MYLRYPSPRHLLDDLTPEEYSELLAFSQIEPLGWDREDWRHVVACSIAAAAAGDKTAADDYALLSPAWSDRREATDWEQIAAAIREANDDAGKDGDRADGGKPAVANEARSDDASD